MSELTLISQDLKEYIVDKSIMIKYSKLIKELLDDNAETTSLNIPNVMSTYLELIIEFCNYDNVNEGELIINKTKKLGVSMNNKFENVLCYDEIITCKSKKIDENVPKWYAEFITKVDKIKEFKSLYEFKRACDYMQIEQAYDLAQLLFETKIKDLTPVEVAAVLGKPFQPLKINGKSKKSRELLSIEYQKPESDIKLGRVLD